MSSSTSHWRHRLSLPEYEMTALERTLWVAVALVLIGDVGTTFVGLHLGFVEANPVARGAIESYGLVGMLVLKTVAVGVGLLCRPLLDRKYRAVVPAGLALPWAVAVCVNLYLIVTVV